MFNKFEHHWWADRFSIGLHFILLSRRDWGSEVLLSVLAGHVEGVVQNVSTGNCPA